MLLLVGVLMLGCGEMTQPESTNGYFDNWGKTATDVYLAIQSDPAAPAGTTNWLLNGNLDQMPESMKTYVLGMVRTVTMQSTPSDMMFIDVNTSWSAVKNIFRPCEEGGDGGETPPDGGDEPGGPPSG